VVHMAEMEALVGGGEWVPRKVQEWDPQFGYKAEEGMLRDEWADTRKDRYMVVEEDTVLVGGRDQVQGQHKQDMHLDRTQSDSSRSPGGQGPGEDTRIDHSLDEDHSLCKMSNTP
jgi:hypothetical protein